jgi:DNA-binding transcriptional regulator YdaS (Cro superfamily)
LAYLNRLNFEERQDFATRCGTSVGYLRKAASVGQLGEGLCIRIDRESAGVVTCEDLRPDVDWAYLRRSAPVCEGGSAGGAR